MWGRMDFVKQKNQDQRCGKVVGGQGRTRRGPGRTKKARGRGGRSREGGGDGEKSAEGARAERAEAMETSLQREPERAGQSR